MRQLIHKPIPDPYADLVLYCPKKKEIADMVASEQLCLWTESRVAITLDLNVKSYRLLSADDLYGIEERLMRKKESQNKLINTRKLEGAFIDAYRSLLRLKSVVDLNGMTLITLFVSTKNAVDNGTIFADVIAHEILPAMYDSPYKFKLPDSYISSINDTWLDNYKHLDSAISIHFNVIIETMMYLKTIRSFLDEKAQYKIKILYNRILKKLEKDFIFSLNRCYSLLVSRDLFNEKPDISKYDFHVNEHVIDSLTAQMNLR